MDKNSDLIFQHVSFSSGSQSNESPEGTLTLNNDSLVWTPNNAASQTTEDKESSQEVRILLSTIVLHATQTENEGGRSAILIQTFDPEEEEESTEPLGMPFTIQTGDENEEEDDQQEPQPAPNDDHVDAQMFWFFLPEAEVQSLFEAITQKMMDTNPVEDGNDELTF
ncbi:hypothetical protein BLNAU_14620 [Blattamonas nauphoetae]|uniref:Uncharacterized protein n=1 Tax=Blattamonas nauphoetae TaxID=2049346 RepID=A0ABQ9XIP7_9EUKA|nr:hypothetical protein BLNAU_14620 [Blattamonas nauphoetae]